MAILKLLFADIKLDSLLKMNIVILPNAKLLKVRVFCVLCLMGVDVKLNLQETDYGNFLSEEVHSLSYINDSS